MDFLRRVFGALRRITGVVVRLAQRVVMSVSLFLVYFLGLVGVAPDVAIACAVLYFTAQIGLFVCAAAVYFSSPRVGLRAPIEESPLGLDQP